MTARLLHLGGKFNFATPRLSKVWLVGGARFCHLKHEPVRVSLFGLGRIGPTHYQNLRQNPHVSLVNVVEFDCSIAEKYIKENDPSANVEVINYNEVDEVYNNKSIDAVVVASSTTTHEDIIINSINNGKHVFCEKPLSSKIASVQECYKLAKEKELVLHCAFNRRYDPAMNKLHNRVNAGDIGNLQFLRLVARDPAPPSLEYMKVSGHLFLDCVIHTIDLALWITGSYPTKVYATGSTQFADTRQVNNIDSTTAVLSFPNDVTVTLDTSRATTFGTDHRIEAFGSRGMLMVDNVRHTTVDMYNSNGTTKDHMYYFMDRFNEAYKLQMDQFINVLQGKENLRVTEEQVINGIKVANACWKSVQTGQAVDVDYS